MDMFQEKKKKKKIIMNHTIKYFNNETEFQYYKIKKIHLLLAPFLV